MNEQAGVEAGTMQAGLLLEDSLPVALERVPALPTGFALARLNEANDWFLKAHFVLHDCPEIDEHDEVQLELRRLDLKMNLLIDMVGDLVAGQRRLPEPAPLRLSAEALLCPIDVDVAPAEGVAPADEGVAPRNAGIAQGDTVIVSLYLNPVIPRPLRLPGVVEEVKDASAAIRFAGLSEPVRDGLEKLIFRHHRKTVAQSRARSE